MLTLIGSAQQGGPYKVLKTARAGGEGGWDYIYADAAGRRLYIPRRGGGAGVQTRLTIFNLDTLEPAGEIAGVGGNGTAVDPKSGHGFTSSKPISMFDTKTMKLIKTIDPGAAQPDGIYFDAFNERVYVFSHPTKDATVIDAKEGTVLGKIDLGGVPEQGVGDGKGMLYVVMQDAQGSVTAVDVKTMKAVAHYPFGDKGRCNGLALDAKNHVLFAACASSGNPPAQPAQPMMVILSAKDGKILTSLPLAGGSDGAVFNPATKEAFSTQGQRHVDRGQGEEPDEFRGGAESEHDEWRPDHRVRPQDEPHLYDEPGARAGAAGTGDAAGQAEGPRAPGHGGTRFVYDSDDRQVNRPVPHRLTSACFGHNI